MAAPSTVKVFTVIRDSTGAGLANQTVHLILAYNAVTVTATGDSVAPFQQTVATDATGTATFTAVVPVDLLSPANVVYTVVEPSRAYDIAPLSTGGASQQTTAVGVIVNQPGALAAATQNVTGPLTVAGAFTAQGSVTLIDGSVADAAGIRIKGGNPWYDAKAFGAKGDGIADDTSAIQTAMTAATNAGGGVVYLPKGTYKLTSTPTWGNKVALIGAGRELTIINANFNGTALYPYNVAGASVQGLKVVGSGNAGFASQYLFAAQGATDLLIRDLHLDSSSFTGFYLANLAAQAAQNSTGTSATTLTDTTQAWTANQWAGFTVAVTNGTTQSYGVITSNTATVLTLTSDGWINGTPPSGTSYQINQPCADVTIDGLYVTNTFQASAGVGGTAVDFFAGTSRLVAGLILIDGADGHGLLVDAGTSSSGLFAAQCSDIAVGTVVARNVGRAAVGSGVMIKGGRNIDIGVAVVDNTGANLSAGVRFTQNQNQVPTTDCQIGLLTTRDTGAQAVDFAGAQRCKVNAARSRNVGMSVPGGSAYGVTFQAATVLAGRTQDSVIDNTVDSIDIQQDAGLGKYTHGVLYDGAVVNCYRNAVINSRLGAPATAMYLYNGANAPVTGPNGNLISGPDYHVGSIGAQPSAAAGAQAGTSPPAPTVHAGATDQAGVIGFGTGTGPTVGVQCVVTFSKPYPAQPKVFLGAANGNCGALGALSVVGFTTSGTDYTGFQVQTQNAPSAGFATDTYQFAYRAEI